MVLHMSRPHRHPKTGVYYFRQKTPADLRSKFGKAEAVWSLKTKDPTEAKIRHSEAARRQALVWESLRALPAAIPHKQLVALSGVFYRELVDMLECEPGETKLWRTMLHKFEPARY